jgi:hypothetical protein
MASKKRKSRRERKKPSQPARIGHPPRKVLGDLPLVRTPSGEVKMSEVLLDFIEPYRDHCHSEEALRRLIVVSLVAWNAALVPEAERAKLIADLTQTVPSEVRGDMLSIVGEMLLRKQTYFADNKRFIVDYELTMSPTGPHLSVISTLDQAAR